MIKKNEKEFSKKIEEMLKKSEENIREKLQDIPAKNVLLELEKILDRKITSNNIEFDNTIYKISMNIDIRKKTILSITRGLGEDIEYPTNVSKSLCDEFIELIKQFPSDKTMVFQDSFPFYINRMIRAINLVILQNCIPKIEVNISKEKAMLILFGINPYILNSGFIGYLQKFSFGNCDMNTYKFINNVFINNNHIDTKSFFQLAIDKGFLTIVELLDFPSKGQTPKRNKIIYPIAEKIKSEQPTLTNPKIAKLVLEEINKQYKNVKNMTEDTIRKKLDEYFKK